MQKKETWENLRESIGHLLSWEMVNATLNNVILWFNK